MPTLQRFIELVAEHGVSFELREQVHGPRGIDEVRVFVRRLVPRIQPLIAIAPHSTNDDEPLRPQVVRSLCRQLALDVREFGLVDDGPKH